MFSLASRIAQNKNALNESEPAFNLRKNKQQQKFQSRVSSLSLNLSSDPMSQ